MNESSIKIRLMQADDFDAVVGIDEKVLKASRPDYYKMKFEKLFESNDYLPASLVAEEENGTVVGFVMGELYMGEYGIFREEASLDTIGVDPDYQHKGIGEQLINEFVDSKTKAPAKVFFNITSCLIFLLHLGHFPIETNLQLNNLNG